MPKGQEVSFYGAQIIASLEQCFSFTVLVHNRTHSFVPTAMFIPMSCWFPEEI